MQPPTPTNFRGGGILDGQNSANVINGKPLMVKLVTLEKHQHNLNGGQAGSS